MASLFVAFQQAAQLVQQAARKHMFILQEQYRMVAHMGTPRLLLHTEARGQVQTMLLQERDMVSMVQPHIGMMEH
jgi:hypothetical protein